MARRLRVLVCCAALAACGTQDVELLDGARDGAPSDLVVDDGPTTDAGADTGACVPQSCEGHATACANCVDDDGDGLVDSADPECLGPCDNSEVPGLLPGIGGETSVICSRDCYFDFGDGAGNDDCYWDHRCDPYEVAPSFWPRGSMCAYDVARVGAAMDCPATQSATCHSVCAPLTPNGCDCFGCCTFDALRGRAASAGGEYVYIGSVVAHDSSCTLAALTDTTLCQPCTPVPDCMNDCGRCELCVGRATLPADCAPAPDGGTIYRCAAGVEACGLPGDPPCPTGTYCITGCCAPFG